MRKILRNKARSAMWLAGYTKINKPRRAPNGAELAQILLKIPARWWAPDGGQAKDKSACFLILSQERAEIKEEYETTYC